MTHTDCGGTILTRGSGEQAEDYCDRCAAFRYHSDEDEKFPTGTSRMVNLQAWHDGERRSPDY